MGGLGFDLPRILPLPNYANQEDRRPHCADEERRALLHTATALRPQLTPVLRHHFFSIPHHHSTTSPVLGTAPSFSVQSGAATLKKQPAHPPHHAITALIYTCRRRPSLEPPSLPSRSTFCDDQRLLQSLLFLASSSRPESPPLIPRLRPMRSLAR